MISFHDLQHSCRICTALIRAAIVKGFLSFEDERFKVIVHPCGVRCVYANFPKGHQKVKPCMQHLVEYVKYFLTTVCRGE